MSKKEKNTEFDKNHLENEMIDLKNDEKVKKQKKKHIGLKIFIVLLLVLAIGAGGFVLYTEYYIPQKEYKNALVLMENENYKEAYAILKRLGKTDEIIKNKYDRGLALIDAKNYKDAYSLLKGIEYIDSQDKADECLYKLQKKNLKKGKIKKGAYVKFGAYEQDNNEKNGAEEIEWLVLDVNKNRAVLISKYALDCLQYNDTRVSTTWEYCSLREWLNSDFYNTAFSKSHKKSIKESFVSADKNPENAIFSPYGQPGNNTKDYVYLLSTQEAEKYFNSKKARKCKITDYAVSRGGWGETDYYCWWWLRTPGMQQGDATSVTSEGKINYNGFYVVSDSDGEDYVGYSALYKMISVRPVIEIAL